MHTALCLFRFLQLPAGTTFDKMMGVKSSKHKKKDGMLHIGPKMKFEGSHSDGLPLSITFQVSLAIHGRPFRQAYHLPGTCRELRWDVLATGAQWSPWMSRRLF